MLRHSLYFKITSRIILAGIIFFYGCEKESSPPEAAFTFNPNSGHEATTFYFDASASTDKEDPASSLKIRWDWQNDGLWDTDWSTNKTVNHVFQSEGSFYVTMEVIDSDGLTNATTNMVNVQNAPTANFSAIVRSGPLPLKVAFSDESSYQPTSWMWNFGDGNTSTEQHPVHTYEEVGFYTVSLAVSGLSGSDSVTKHNYIIAGEVYNSGIPCPDAPTVSWKGQTYKTVLIFTQCWMKENLNWDTGVNWCYDNDPANCVTYGRLYQWSTILNGESPSFNDPFGVQGICPNGWHIPSHKEWMVLEGGADSEYGVGASLWNTSSGYDTSWRGLDVGTNLKSVEGWEEAGGIDKFGLNILPAGYSWKNSSSGNVEFSGQITDGIFWTSYRDIYPLPWRSYVRVFNYANPRAGLLEVNVENDNKGYSLRCVKD